LVLAIIGLGAHVQAADVTEWRIHTPHGKGRTEFIMEKEWADTLTKESGGRLKVTLYPFKALGFNDADMLRIVGQNVIEGYMFYPGYTVRDDPILALTSPEMILYQRQHFINYFPSAVGMARERLASKWNIRLSSCFPSPACYVGIIGKAPFNTLASMKGKKIRAWELQQVDTLQNLDVPCQMMAQSELYLALKTGVLDGAVYIPNAYLNASLYEVAPNWSTLYQGSMMLGMATSKAAFEALPADLQEMVKRVETQLSKKWLGEAKGWCSEYDEPAFPEVKKKGAKILDPFPEAEQELLVQTGREVWRERAKAHSAEAVEYQKQLEAALMKAKP
jgi:TRAP-type C4-dicarboxylate transport system substrate-binding protein